MIDITGVGNIDILGWAIGLFLYALTSILIFA